MPFTAIFFLFALLASAVLFVAVYRWKGWKAAFIASGITLFLLVAFLMAALNFMLSGM